jgi:uncharacterized protein YndB with AHSA1/START domain
VAGTEPIVLSIELPVTPARAFEWFAPNFASWWPVATHSLGRSTTTEVQLQCEPGGAIEERSADGPWHRWGTVEAYEPGGRLRFNWHPGRDPESAQWVEVVFEPHAGGTRATLTHGGWEALGEIAPILRREYAAGWQYVFGEAYAGLVRKSAGGPSRSWGKSSGEPTA